MNVLRLLAPERRAREARVLIRAEFYVPIEVTADGIDYITRRIESALDLGGQRMDGLDIRVTAENRCEHRRWPASCTDCQANREQTLIAHELGLIA
jgi:hypothetical protein